MARWANENAFDGNFKSAAQVWGVPVPLLKAFAAQESRFDPRARRAEPYLDAAGKPRIGLGPTPDFPKGGDESRGLMQILARTARGLGYAGPLDGLYDPALNIALGAQLLRGLLRTAKTQDAAISAYNAGFSGVRPGDGKRVSNAPGAPFINQSYVDAVNGYLRYFQAQTLPASPTPELTATPGKDSGELTVRGGLLPALLPDPATARTYFIPNLATIAGVALLLVLLLTARGQHAR